MDKFELADKLRNSPPVDKAEFIVNKCRGKNVLDMGCIRHSAEFAMADPHWLHAKIKAVATKVTGLDYLPAEIAKVNAHGYNITYGDVTKPLSLSDRFDVIVAADLIEHLSNFDGFFQNCTQLLAEKGVLIITTPNPFYIEGFHFVALKRQYSINPEHTCWIDPQALNQLANRYKYVFHEVHFLKDSWKIKHLISETKNDPFDILLGQWRCGSRWARLRRRIIGELFSLIYTPYKMLSVAVSSLTKHSDYVAVLARE